MLQAQKVRVVDFIDDRTKDLTKFGEDYNEELEEIGKNVLSNLDETSGQVSHYLCSISG